MILSLQEDLQCRPPSPFLFSVSLYIWPRFVPFSSRFLSLCLALSVAWFIGLLTILGFSFPQAVAAHRGPQDLDDSYQPSPVSLSALRTRLPGLLWLER